MCRFFKHFFPFRFLLAFYNGIDDFRAFLIRKFLFCKKVYKVMDHLFIFFDLLIILLIILYNGIDDPSIIDIIKLLFHKESHNRKRSGFNRRHKII